MEVRLSFVTAKYSPLINESHKTNIILATLCMMRNLEIERVALAAMAVGIARRSLDEMIAYGSDRPAFGKPNLFSFGQIQKHIADSYAEYMAGKCYLYGITNGLDLSTYGNGLDADGVKLYCAPMAKKVADRAMQVMGGYGYVGEYNVERLWVSFDCLLGSIVPTPSRSS